MRTSIVMIAWLLAGCYNYNPLTTPNPVPGTYLAATLTDQGSEDLARHLGPGVFVVRGRYLGEGDGAMLLSVSSVEMKRGNEVDWAGETVTLPTSAVASLEVRRLAKGRSAMLVGLGVTGLVATTVAFGLNGDATPVASSGRRPTKQ